MESRHRRLELNENGLRMLHSRHMLILARWILFFGALSLVSGGIRLARAALDAGLPAWQLGWIIPVAVLLGGAKARFVMRRRMRANITRLVGTKGRLWLWQIYPPQMLAFILAMVLVVHFLKKTAADSALGLGLLGGLDFAVAVALVVASLEYRGVGAAQPR